MMFPRQRLGQHKRFGDKRQDSVPWVELPFNGEEKKKKKKRGKEEEREVNGLGQEDKTKSDASIFFPANQPRDNASRSELGWGIFPNQSFVTDSPLCKSYGL